LYARQLNTHPFKHGVLHPSRPDNTPRL
jgi:hypothetical protein